MIHVLITGELTSDPTERTSAAGRTFVTAQLRVGVGDTSTFIGLTAFDSTASAKLLALRKGDSLAAAGVMRQTSWTGRDGQERTGWSVTAAQVMTIYEAGKRKKVAASTAGTADDPFNGGDEL